MNKYIDTFSVSLHVLERWWKNNKFIIDTNVLDGKILTDSTAYTGTMKRTATIHFCSWKEIKNKGMRLLQKLVTQKLETYFERTSFFFLILNGKSMRSLTRAETVDRILVQHEVHNSCQYFVLFIKIIS